MGLTPHVALLPSDTSAAASGRNTVSRPTTAGYVLSSPADVSELLNNIPLLGLRSRGSVSVRVPAMGASTQLRWERRLTLWLNACGCQTGALLFLSSLVWRVFVVLHDPPQTWGNGVANVGWVFGAAVIGKVSGLAIARVLLVLDLKRLSGHMATRSAVPSEVQL